MTEFERLMLEGMDLLLRTQWVPQDRTKSAAHFAENSRRLDAWSQKLKELEDADARFEETYFGEVPKLDE